MKILGIAALSLFVLLEEVRSQDDVNLCSIGDSEENNGGKTLGMFR